MNGLPGHVAGTSALPLTADIVARGPGRPRLGISAATERLTVGAPQAALNGGPPTLYQPHTTALPRGVPTARAVALRRPSAVGVPEVLVESGCGAVAVGVVPP